MASNEKFQAGESYSEARAESSASFLSDPVKVARALLKECAGLHGQASVEDITGLIQQLTSKGQPLDDKKGYNPQSNWEIIEF
jgi:hypothetical protein